MIIKQELNEFMKKKTRALSYEWNKYEVKFEELAYICRKLRMPLSFTCPSADPLPFPTTDSPLILPMTICYGFPTPIHWPGYHDCTRQEYAEKASLACKPLGSQPSWCSSSYLQYTGDMTVMDDEEVYIMKMSTDLYAIVKA